MHLVTAIVFFAGAALALWGNAENMYSTGRGDRNAITISAIVYSALSALALFGAACYAWGKGHDWSANDALLGVLDVAMVASIWMALVVSSTTKQAWALIYYVLLLAGGSAYISALLFN